MSIYRIFGKALLLYLCEFFVDYVDLILLHSTRCKLIPTLLVNPFLCQASAQVHDPVSGGWVDK